MLANRTHRWTRATILAASTVIASTLGGCGGGSGVGMASTPAPIAAAPAPAPSPPSTPAPTATVFVPAAASLPAAPAFPQAAAGGPTLAAPGSAVLPLLQTVRVDDRRTVSVDTATMSAGATLALDPAASRATFNVANPALGVSNTTLGQDPNTVFFETVGSSVVRLDFAQFDWTAYGEWLVFPGGVNPVTTRHEAKFVTGFQTPGSVMPTTGAARYVGFARGDAFGTATLDVDFVNRTLTGALTDMQVGNFEDGYLPFHSLSLSANFSAGQSRFSGTTAVLSGPGNPASPSVGTVGTLVGSFFGPGAEELGAVWTLFDGTAYATGSLGAKRH